MSAKFPGGGGGGGGSKPILSHPSINLGDAFSKSLSIDDKLTFTILNPYIDNIFLSEDQDQRASKDL